MRNIRFLQIKFFSYKKKTGRILNLDNDIVIVKGGNQSGRSSMLMSLYSSLGAEIKTFSPQWKQDNIITLLKVSIDGVVFQFLHIGKEYYVFDLNGHLYYKSSNRLANGSKLANLLGFNLTFTNDETSKVQMPVEFMFLPFYISQDKGWDQPLRSFESFNVYGGKRNALYYYIGVIKDDYFLICNNLDEANAQLRKVELELEYDGDFSSYINERIRRQRITVNISDFDKEKDEFVTKASEMKKELGQLLTDLRKMYDRKAYLEYRKQQMHDNFREIDNDLKYAISKEEKLTCPMCGAHVKNDAVGTYMMIQDKNQCKNAILEYEKEINIIQNKIENLEAKSLTLRDSIKEIELLLVTKKNDIEFKDVLYSEMFKYLEETLSDREKDALMRKAELENRLREMLDKAKLYEDNDFKDFVDEDFKCYVTHALREMNVSSIFINENHIKFGHKISMDGSLVSKCIVAYTYAYYELIKKYSGKLFCPIVIDETNQNGVDRPGEKAIVDFLIEHKPNDAQLILSINNDVDINSKDAIVLDLQAGKELLIEDDFYEVATEVETLLGENFEMALYNQ